MYFTPRARPVSPGRWVFRPNLLGLRFGCRARTRVTWTNKSSATANPLVQRALRFAISSHRVRHQFSWSPSPYQVDYYVLRISAAAGEPGYFPAQSLQRSCQISALHPNLLFISKIQSFVTLLVGIHLILKRNDHHHGAYPVKQSIRLLGVHVIRRSSRRQEFALREFKSSDPK